MCGRGSATTVMFFVVYFRSECIELVMVYS